MDKWKDDIEKYRSGKLTPAKRHALEKKALSDPFLADALEGAEEITVDSFSADVEELNKKILDEKKNKWLWPLRIAASVVGIALIGTLIIYSTSDSTENLASNQEKKDQAPAESKTDTVNQSLAQSGDTIKDQRNQTEKNEPRQNENLVASLKAEEKESKPAPLNKLLHNL